MSLDHRMWDIFWKLWPTVFGFQFPKCIFRSLTHLLSFASLLIWCSQLFRIGRMGLVHFACSPSTLGTSHHIWRESRIKEGKNLSTHLGFCFFVSPTRLSLSFETTRKPISPLTQLIHRGLTLLCFLSWKGWQANSQTLYVILPPPIQQKCNSPSNCFTQTSSFRTRFVVLVF